MKNFFRLFQLIGFILLINTISFSLFATDIKLKQQKETKLTVKESTFYKLHVVNTLSEISTTDINTTKGYFTELTIPGYSPSTEVGSPKLPLMRKLIEVPLDAEVTVNIIHYDVEEYSLKDQGINYSIMPAQPPVPKIDHPKIDFKYNKSVYKKNQFLYKDIATVEELGTMRGVRMARLNIAPIQYNPSKNIIRVYTNIEVEIVFNKPNIDKTILSHAKTQSPYFNSTFHQLLNYKKNSYKDLPIRYPVKYVIVSDPMFHDALQPFIQWKTKKGFTVIEAYTDNPEVGTTTISIKSYLESLYEAATPSDPAPTFVLLVGDVAQIPAFEGTTGSHPTDLYYAEYTSDFLPELYYGRFSANNVDQLQPQIDKTLEYEQYQIPDPSYLNEVVMVSGVDGTYAELHGNGQINYGTTNYFNVAHGITSHTYLYPASASSASQIIQDVSDGVAYANYTAHGSITGWADPSFDISDIAGLANNHKYPLMVGNACVTNTYSSTCFGEALLRAANKGAIGYIGASDNSQWDEDFYWGVGARASITVNPSYQTNALGAYDRTFHDHAEPFEDWFAAQGQMVNAGNLAVTQAGSEIYDYYWEIYHLMGDPSLMVYFSVPSTMTSSHSPLLPLATSSFTVNTDPYAYVAISQDSVLHGAALADSEGVAVIPIDPFIFPCTASIIITKQNMQPLFDSVMVGVPDGPYVLLKDYTIVDSASNNNGHADFGETVFLNTTLFNYGNADDSTALAILSTNDTSVCIQDSLYYAGLILSSDSVALLSAFSFVVDSLISDQHTVLFNLEVKDSSENSWNSYLSIKLNAPHFSLPANIVIDDSDGNDNGRIDTGETVKILVITSNNGHMPALNTWAYLTTTNTYITIVDTAYYFDTLTVAEVDTAEYTIIASSSIPIAESITLNYRMNSGLYSSQKEYTTQAGLIVEDWETGQFNDHGFTWTNGGNAAWSIVSNVKHEGTYSAKSGNINDDQTSQLLLQNVYVYSADSISFYYKVSSEEDFDYLTFSIDNNELGAWSGDQDWTRVAYPVSMGSHTFKWTYLKDEWSEDGSDRAWIDYIVFPPMSYTTANSESINGNSFDFICYPNPINRSAIVSFALPEKTEISLTLFDAMGKNVKSIIDTQSLQPGKYNLRVDASFLSKGIYYITLKTTQWSTTKKIVVIH